MPITGDAWDFLSTLKEILLKEVEHEDALKRTMTEFWDLFAHGSTTYSTQCHVCQTLSIEEQPFTELILYFDERYHQQGNNTTNACSLGDLMKNSSSAGDTIDDYNCRVCNQKTKATRTNSVHQYPKVLCIALSRASYGDKLVRTSVDFPIVNFKPKDYSNVQENTDDVAYDLLATVCHIPRTNGGHYIAICKQHHSGVWYSYNDDQVEKSDFTKLSKGGVSTAKVEFQRRATLLFYIKKQSAQVDASLVAGDDGNDDVSTNSTPNSRTSRFSALANDNITTQLNARSTSSTNDDQSLSDSDNNHSDDDDKQNSAFASGPGACSWGMEDGVTSVFGNSYCERCCWFNKPVIPCAHNGCNATVHQTCQLDWFWRMNDDFVRNGLSKRFDDNKSGPFFCPEHNIQRTEYINSRKRST